MKNKKILLSIILFVVVFLVTYLYLCYFTGLRIKLAAEPMEYFIESIKYATVFKSVVSYITSFILATIPYIISKDEKNE